MRNIFPLQPNTPYKTREGKRVILEPYNVSVLKGDNDLLYILGTGAVRSGAENPRDIVDFFIEPGLWQTSGGKAVGIRLREGYKYEGPYPLVAYNPDNGEVLYSITTEGYYYEGAMPQEHDIAAYLGSVGTSYVPDDGFLKEGYWLRRDNRVVTLVYYVAQGAFLNRDNANTLYKPHSSLGRAYSDRLSVKDLIRPLTADEAHFIKATPETKGFFEFLNEGLLLCADDITLTEVPPAWMPMMQEWAQLCLDNPMLPKHTLCSARTIADMATYPDTVTFRIEQFFLLDKYKVQTNNFDAWYQDFVTDTSYPTARATEYGVELIYTPRKFIQGGAYINSGIGYYDSPIPSYHTSPDMMLVFNSPRAQYVGRTYNPITNWQVAINRYVNSKIANDEYQEVPHEFPIKWGTGVHISTQNPALLAYFPTLGHFQRKVPQQIKPGRYLKQFFPDMSDDRIRRLSALFGKGELRFYSKWQDMLAAYRELDTGGVVSSCMSKDNWGLLHPLMVYDNSDVELAVLYRGDQPVARALYNKRNKHFPMIYGQWEKMEVAMRDAGFIHDSLCGAKIRRLPARLNSYKIDTDGINRNTIDLDDLANYDDDPDTILMPYIDHKRELDRSSNCSTNIEIHYSYCVIDYDGSVEANNHEYARVNVHGGQVPCDHCNTHVDADDTYWVDYDEVRVCHYCYDNRVVEVCGSRDNFTALEASANHNFVYVTPARRWYEDVSAASDAGYCWSEYDGEFYRDCDCVWVEDMDDYIHDNEVGTVCQYDELEGVYVSMDEYNSRIAEREQAECEQHAA